MRLDRFSTFQAYHEGRSREARVHYVAKSLELRGDGVPMEYDLKKGRGDIDEEMVQSVHRTAWEIQ